MIFVPVTFYGNSSAYFDEIFINIKFQPIKLPTDGLKNCLEHNNIKLFKSK